MPNHLSHLLSSVQIIMHTTTQGREVLAMRTLVKVEVQVIRYKRFIPHRDSTLDIDVTSTRTNVTQS